MPILVNVKPISAREDIILPVPQEEARPEKRVGADAQKSNRNKGGKRERTWLEKVKRQESTQRKRTSDGKYIESPR